MIIMKSKFIAGSQAAVPAAVPSLGLASRVGALYDLVQNSDHVFGSPLGPLRLGESECYLPRFVYFGPSTSEESIRLAVFAGFSPRDHLAAQAVIGFVDNLARGSDIGQSLNISFFPVVNVAALCDGETDRDLGGEHWARSRQPELVLLNQDARRCGRQGFVRVTTTVGDVPSARVRTVRSTSAHTSAIEVFSSADLHPWVATFETLAAEEIESGPLSLADDLPFAPFEVELALPAKWSQRRADAAIALVLRRVIVRYRAFLAYGQNL